MQNYKTYHNLLFFHPWKPSEPIVFFLTTYKYFKSVILLLNFIFLLVKKFFTV
jgi:hypothetical protein